MPPKTALPPPPRPDPVTLDQIYHNLTATGISIEQRAYHLVSLNTVAFHPTVKRFICEYSPLPEDAGAPSEAVEAVRQANRRRREALLKSIAFFVAQRGNPVAEECRWETISLLGELCRVEATGSGTSPFSDRSGTSPGSGPSSTSISDAQRLQDRLNRYAVENMEYLATLPWFRPALVEIADPQAAAKAAAEVPSGASNGKSRLSSSSAAGRRRANEEAVYDVGDEDVKIAGRDILAAMPTVAEEPLAAAGGPATAPQRVVWSDAQKERVMDLMFLDYSNHHAHLIPLVARCSSVVCAGCLTPSATAAPAGGDAAATTSGTGGSSGTLQRCASCKAVFYCSAACQREHWARAHKVPCVSYKDRRAAIDAQYFAMNARARPGKGGGAAAAATIAVLEVPLEPSLFFETRRYLYDHRDPTLEHVPFDKYFMEFTAKGG